MSYNFSLNHTYNNTLYTNSTIHSRNKWTYFLLLCGFLILIIGANIYQRWLYYKSLQYPPHNSSQNRNTNTNTNTNTIIDEENVIIFELK